MVYQQVCRVDGELARYTGPVNAAGQRHGPNGLLVWADEKGQYPIHDNANAMQRSKRHSFHQGHFDGNFRSGPGVFYYHEQDRTYRGYFHRGVLTTSIQGETGSLRDDRQGLEYQGHFARGQPEGHGTCTYWKYYVMHKEL